jgi:hypothetical protein
MKKSTQTSIVNFRLVQAASLTTGMLQISLQPGSLSGSTRIPEVADGFAFYKLTRLRFRMHRSADANPCSIAFVPGAPNTVPATASAANELLHGTYYVNTYTAPSQWVKVPAADLKGQFEWYKTITGTEVADLAYPGSITAQGTTTDAIVYEIVGTYVFKEPISTANTPAELALLRRMRQDREVAARAAAKDRMLKILSTDAGKTGGPGGS